MQESEREVRKVVFIVKMAENLATIFSALKATGYQVSHKLVLGMGCFRWWLGGWGGSGAGVGR